MVIRGRAVSDKLLRVSPPKNARRGSLDLFASCFESFVIPHNVSGQTEGDAHVAEVLAKISIFELIWRIKAYELHMNVAPV
jgi:hypothetical protein